MNYVTLPLPIFLLTLSVVAFVTAMITAGAATFALRAREQRLHAGYRRRAGSGSHPPGDAPFYAGELQEHHRRAAQLARQAVRRDT